MDLNKIWMFLEVIRAGSFTLASKNTGLAKSSLSEKIKELEQEMGTTLIVRTTRSLQLTEAGHVFFKSATAGLKQIESAQNEVKVFQESPRGKIRISVLVGLANSAFVESLGKFLEDYPEINLEISFSDRRVNLLEEGFDLCIRSGNMEDSSLISKKIGNDRYILVSSPNYLKKIGDIKTPADLKKTALINRTSDSEIWKLHSDSNKIASLEAKTRVCANNIDAIKRLVMGGHGIALLPSSVCSLELKSKRLIHILPQWAKREHSIYLIYPFQRFLPPKLRAIIPYIESGFKNIT